MTERIQIDGKAVRSIRRKRGQTIAELAEIVGIAEGSLNRIELGSRARQIRPVGESLARALGVSPAEIIVNYPPETGRHRAAVERALAEAPPIDAEQARAIRSLLAGYAEAARRDRELATGQQTA